MKHIVLTRNGSWAVQEEMKVLGVYPTQAEAIKNHKDAWVHRKDGTIRCKPKVNK